MSRDALVVGINVYTYDGLNNLKAPATDAEVIALLLSQHGDFNVWRLPEAVKTEDNSFYVGKKTKVTFTKFEDALVKLFKPENGRNIPDTALFYFSGHGIRKTKGASEGFLATSDVNPDIGLDGLSLQWLRRLLQESPIKQQIVWLDCCHSGELLNFAEANPGEAGQVRDRCFIAASREFEQAWEDLGESYSVMTKILLKGLDPNRCRSRWVTNYSLVDYLNENLENATQRPIFTNFGQPINLTRIWEIGEEKITTEVGSICPYKGLQYFDCNEEDPKYFHGREHLTDQLIDQVLKSNFLAILGASGSGKSSVLRAGLLHQLKLGRKLAGSQTWQYLIILPGDRPMQNLAQAFIDPNLPKLDKAEHLAKAEGLLKEGADGLRRLVQSSNAPKTILVIDQFEEVFTLCSDQKEREEFFKCVLGTSEQLPDKVCLILTMRADFFGKCVEQEYSGLAKKIQKHLIFVTPMNQEQLKDAISKPATQVKLKVEPILIEQILRDIEGSPGSLPLLEYTLTELWNERTNNCLKLATYTTLGGIGGTLNQRATQVYQQLTPEEQETAKHIFLSLTQLGEGTEDTRKRVFKQDLVTAKHSSDLVDKVIQKLADEKLIADGVTKGLKPIRGREWAENVLKKNRSF